MTGGDGPFQYDDAGNPLLRRGQSVQTLCCREVQGHYPPGKYVATWQGMGKVEIRKWDITRVVKETRNRIEFEVVPADGGIEVNVVQSDPREPVHNLSVIMPGFEKAKSRFHPLFLERLGPARVLRFMDWQHTNNSPVVSWSQRTKTDDARWSGDGGVPVEVMCELANLREAAPWFCVPHQADDEYVREFARLVKQKLAPGRKVYLEYSNEVWNWQFGQTKWAREQGLQKTLGDPEHARFYSERAVQIFGIWEKEFGGKDRLVRVLASQSAVPWISEQILTWKNAYKHADALAIAPYFGYDFGDPKNAAETARLTPDELLDRLGKEVDGENREQIRKQSALARKYKLQLVAYEGGQHLTGYGGAENNEQLTKLFQSANRHPKMYDLYRRHLKTWDAAGGGLYVLFANVARPTKWGSWGLLEYQDQPIAWAPKYRAFLDHAAGK
jgi:hypothetical protein